MPTKVGACSCKNLVSSLSKNLTPKKARLKLLIALNAGLTGQDLKDYMEG